MILIRTEHCNVWCVKTGGAWHKYPANYCSCGPQARALKSIEECSCKPCSKTWDSRMQCCGILNPMTSGLDELHLMYMCRELSDLDGKKRNGEDTRKME